MKRIQLLILVSLIFLKINSLNANEINFSNVTKELNLPSKECYSIFQDSRGFFWVSTDMGLVKCTKTSSKLFDSRKGIDENSVYYLNENKDGEIEILTAANRFLKVIDDKIVKTKYTDKIIRFLENEDKKFGQNAFSLIYFLNRNDKDDIIFTTIRATYRISKKDGEIRRLNKNYSNLNVNTLFDLVIENKSVNTIKSFKYNSQKRVVLKNNLLFISVHSNGISKIIPIPINNNSHVDWRIRNYKLGNRVFVNIHNTVLVIDNDLNYKILSFPSVVISIYVHPKSGLWVGTTGNGVFHYPNLIDLSSYKKGLPGMSVSSTCIDREGTVWCATLEQGVFSARSDNIEFCRTLAHPNSKITLLKNVNDLLFASSSVDELTIAKDDLIRKVNLFKVGSIEISDVLSFKNEIYIATKGYFGKLDKNFILREKYLNFESNNYALSYQIDHTKDKLFVLAVGFVYELKNNFLFRASRKFSQKASCFKILNNDEAIVGTTNGLYHVSLVGKKEISYLGIKSKVSKIIELNDGTLLVTTLGEGLFELKNGQLKSISLPSDIYQLSDIVQFSENRFFIASQKGLLELKKNGNTFQSHLFNSADGLMSDYVERLTIHQGYLYLAGYDGIFRLDPNNLKQNLAQPYFYFRQFLVNGKALPTSSKLELNHKQNDFKVILDLVQFKTGKNEQIVYQLYGRDTKKLISKSNELIFENLPPGNYKLAVYVRNSEGLKSKTQFISFTINLPYWETWWFISIGFICIVLLVVVIVNYIIQTIKRREKEQTELYRLVEESKLIALQAQMNPHFIFNAINSIQNFILNRKEEEAYDYLAKFSKLIRMVLYNSKENHILLEAELETLKLYISLEQLRFDDAFDFELNLEQNIEPSSIEIPAMFIQPYVENAIWHGIMNLKKERKGKLEIIIKQLENLLFIQIQDNGIGRENSLKLKKDKLHHSVGINNSLHRLEVINKLQQEQKGEVKINDVFDQKGIVCGTKVELFLPINQI